MVQTSRRKSPETARSSAKRGTAKAGPLLAAVERTMEVIEMLADEEAGLSLSEIARGLDVNKQIALRILSTLAQRGYLYQNDHQLYRLTYKISNIGLRQQSTAHLTDQCFPIVRRLADESGELVRLAIIENEKPIWMHAAVGPAHRLRLDPVWRPEVIYHAHAVGKVLLSTLADSAIAARLGPEPYPALTPKTRTSLKALMADIRQVRECGYAISCEETELGVGAIAAPIRAGRNGIYVGIISIAAPISRLTCDALRSWGPRLLEVVAQAGEAWPIPPND